MPKLYSSDWIIKILGNKGFVIVSQKGSHIKMRGRTVPIKTVIIPAGRREIPVGTFQSILRQSGLSIADFD